MTIKHAANNSQTLTQERKVGYSKAVFPFGTAIVAVGLLLSLGGCVQSSVSPEGGDQLPDIAKLASKSEVACEFDGADGLDPKPTCYEVTVPEDWSKPVTDDAVVLQVAVFSVTDAKSNASDALIYLDGGPGGETLNGLGFTQSSLVTPFVADRDVIIFDQRGIGQSTPELSCPEVVDTTLAIDEAEKPYPNAAAEMQKAIKACRDRLVGDGVNLAAYNSVASSNDVEAIRSTLGYEQVNVLGVSYGTRLAQTYLRMYPKSVRSVVLDSVVPIDTDIDESVTVTAKSSLQKVFDACAQDADCAAAHPTLEDDYFKLLDQLDKDPVSVDAFDLEGNSIKAVVDGDYLMRLVFLSLYSKDGFSTIPQMVADALDGRYETISIYATIDLVQLEFVSIGMNFSVECNEEVSFESAEDMADNVPDGDFARLDIVNGPPTFFEICPEWPSGKAPAVENQPVKSDVQALLLAGAFDPVTPPSYAKQVASNLSNSVLFEFPTEGHGTIGTECGTAIVASFLKDPKGKPASTCIAEIPAPQWVP